MVGSRGAAGRQIAAASANAFGAHLPSLRPWHLGADVAFMREDRPDVRDRLQVKLAQLEEGPVQLPREHQISDKFYEAGEFAGVRELVAREDREERFLKGSSFSGSASRSATRPATSSRRNR